jgi:SAM-dependent methyltransferase
VPPDAIALEIDAGRAFGTGQHETTSGCLVALSRLKGAGLSFGNIADIGTGTGLLAFAALRLWPLAEVIASDIDPVSIEVSAENAAINRVPIGRARGEVELVVAPGLDHPRLKARAPYDLLIANILAAPLIELAPALSGAIEPGGRLILAGLLQTQAEAVLAPTAARASRSPSAWSTDTGPRSCCASAGRSGGASFKAVRLSTARLGFARRLLEMSGVSDKKPAHLEQPSSEVETACRETSYHNFGPAFQPTRHRYTSSSSSSAGRSAMRHAVALLLLASTACAMNGTAPQDMAATPRPAPAASIVYPQTERQELVENQFGVAVPDPIAGWRRTCARTRRSPPGSRSRTR